MDKRLRRWSAAADTTFDVLVVGGGIYGATVACRAAQAGLSVALMEKGDYGEAASANSLKILHGGLRYLQQLDIRRVRESIAARRDGLASLPHLARPAHFIAPTGKGLKRSAAAYHVAALLNDLFAYDRNRGLLSSHHLPPTRVVGPRELAGVLPPGSLPARHALSWSDGWIENTERYTLAYVMSARAAGAAVFNQARAVEWMQSGGLVTGARVHDELTGAVHAVNARMTVVACGGWLAEQIGGPALPPVQAARVKAYNIVARRRWFGEVGVGLDGLVDGGRTRRNFFFAPWREGTVIGTMYTPFEGPGDACRLDSSEIRSFVAEINQLYPPARLNLTDITFAHVGLVPGRVDRSGRILPEPSGTTRILEARELGGREGLLVVSGVKYTTAAKVADQVVARLIKRLGPSADHMPDCALYGAEQIALPSDVLAQARQVAWNMPEDVAEWLAAHMGSCHPRLIAMTRTNTGWRAALPGTGIPKVAVLYAVQEEDAVHLTDVVFRRTDLGTFAYPGDEALTVVADWMGEALGWDAGERAREIEAVRQHYRDVGIML